jgi:hypothetical protein
MARKPHPSRAKAGSLPEVPLHSATGLSRRGKRFTLAGMGMAAVGFWLLKWTDPSGQNRASVIAPLFLVAGYILIGIATLIPDPNTGPNTGPAGST